MTVLHIRKHFACLAKQLNAICGSSMAFEATSRAAARSNAAGRSGQQQIRQRQDSDPESAGLLSQFQDGLVFGDKSVSARVVSKRQERLIVTITTARKA